MSDFLQEREHSRKLRQRRDQSNRRSTLIGVVAVTLCALVPALVWGYGTAASYLERRAKEADLNSKLSEAIGRDRGFTETIVRAETDAPNMTYNDFFVLADKSLEERTELLAELRGLYPDIPSPFRDQLIEHLNLENNMVRSKRAMYFNAMQLETQLEGYQSYLYTEPEKSGYFPEFWRNWELTRLELGSATLETSSALTQASEDFEATYAKLCESEPALLEGAKRNGLTLSAVFSACKDSNTSVVKASKQAALAPLEIVKASR